HYHNELSYLQALVERIQAKRLRLDWIHAEQARLAERLEVVDGLCKADTESIVALEDEIAVCPLHGSHWEWIADKHQVLKKRAEAHAEAMTPSLEEYIAEARRIVDEEKAAAAAAKAEGLEPNTSN
ncbi:hypothetical protein FMUND_460, partial [Fusarium mundagurra]